MFRLFAGIFGASNVSKHLSIDFSLPGQPGYETAKKISHLYGNGGDSPSSVVVVTAPAGRTVAGERFFRQEGQPSGVARPLRTRA